MVRNICILVLTAFVAFQGVSGRTYRSEILESRSLIEQTQNAIRQLSELLAKRTELSVSELKAASEQVMAFSKTSVSTATVLLENSVATSLKQIEEVAKDAAVHGKNVTKCTDKHVAEIKNIPVTVINEMVGCVNKNLVSGKSTVETAIVQITGLNKVVYTLQNKLSGCGVGIVGTDCYIEVLNEATKQISILPGKVISLEITATTTLDQIKEEIVGCTIVRVNTEESFVSTKAQIITECIKNL